jgi:hypothetical protein
VSQAPAALVALPLVLASVIGFRSQSATRWNVPADVTAADRRDILQLAAQ